MKRLLVAAGILLAVLTASAAVSTFQVTIGASATQVSATAKYCQWVVFQNNATHNEVVGDSTVSSTNGMVLLPGGSWSIANNQSAKYTNLANYWVSGTQNDALNVACDVVNTGP